MIPNTRFLPSSIRFTLLGVPGQDIQQRPPAFSFQANHSMLESCPDLAIRTWGDCARVVCPAEFLECLENNFPGLMRVADFVFVINRQLLVSLIALTRISQRASPKLAGHSEIAIAFCEPGKRAPGRAVGLDGQRGRNRLFVELPGTNGISPLFADSGHSEQFKPILSLSFSVA